MAGATDVCLTCEYDLSPKHATTIKSMACDVCSESIPVGASVVHWLTPSWTRAVVCAKCARETGMSAKADAYEVRLKEIMSQ